MITHKFKLESANIVEAPWKIHISPSSKRITAFNCEYCDSLGGLAQLHFWNYPYLIHYRQRHSSL
jgi:hypothetical protein